MKPIKRTVLPKTVHKQYLASVLRWKNRRTFKNSYLYHTTWFFVRTDFSHESIFGLPEYRISIFLEDRSLSGLIRVLFSACSFFPPIFVIRPFNLRVRIFVLGPDIENSTRAFYSRANAQPDRLLSAQRVINKHVVEPQSTYFSSKKSWTQWKNQQNGLSILIRP